MQEWFERIPKEKIVAAPLPGQAEIDGLRQELLGALDDVRRGNPSNWPEKRRELFDALRRKSKHHLTLATNLSDALEGREDPALVEASFKRGLETEVGAVNEATLKEAALLAENRNPDYLRDKMRFHRGRGLSLQREAAALKENVYDWIQGKGSEAIAGQNAREKRLKLAEIREFARNLKPEDFED